MSRPNGIHYITLYEKKIKPFEKDKRMRCLSVGVEMCGLPWEHAPTLALLLWRWLLLPI